MSTPCVVLARADPGDAALPGTWLCLTGQTQAISLGSPAELPKLTFATSRIKGQDWGWLLPLKRA